MSESCAKEVQIKCADGMTLKGLRWTSTSTSTNTNTNEHNGGKNPLDNHSTKILCLHGWLDNSASFDTLGPYVCSRYSDATVVAVDLPGHGLSDHRPKSGPITVLADFCYYVEEIVHCLGWNDSKIALIGHSMGAAISLLYAAAMPERIKSLILLDSLGPHPKPADDLPAQLRKHMTMRRSGNSKDLDGLFAGGTYPSKEVAIHTRMETAKVFPGDQWIREESATLLVERASTTMQEDGQLQFLHDARLKWPNLLTTTPEQLKAAYAAVQCPTLILCGESGMPFSEQQKTAAESSIRYCRLDTLPGSHHFHLDPDTSGLVCETVVDFLKETS